MRIPQTGYPQKPTYSPASGFPTREAKMQRGHPFLKAAWLLCLLDGTCSSCIFSSVNSEAAIGPRGLNPQPSDNIIPTLQTSNPQPTYFLKEPRKQRERRGLLGNSFEKYSSSRRILVTSPRLLPKTHYTMFCFHQDTKTEWDCRRTQSVDPHLPWLGFVISRTMEAFTKQVTQDPEYPPHSRQDFLGSVQDLRHSPSHF